MNEHGLINVPSISQPQAPPSPPSPSGYRVGSAAAADFSLVHHSLTGEALPVVPHGRSIELATDYREVGSGSLRLRGWIAARWPHVRSQVESPEYVLEPADPDLGGSDHELGSVFARTADRLAAMPRSPQGWKAVQSLLIEHHRRLAERIRDRLDVEEDVGNGMRRHYSELLLRAAVLTGVPWAPGPYLHPLILRTFPHYADCCRAHGLDPSQLHRVLTEGASISLDRLLAILKGLEPPSGSRRGSGYELRFVAARKIEAQAREPAQEEDSQGPADSAIARGWSLEELCRRMREADGAETVLTLPPDAYTEGYSRRVLRRSTPGSFRFFALAAFPRFAIVPRRIEADRAFETDEREASIRFDTFTASFPEEAS